MTVTIYHNPRCSKSRQALGLLRERGVEPRVVNYLENPPSPGELKNLLERMGLQAADVLRRKEAREAGIDHAAVTEGDLIDLMAANPIVIERPIVVVDDRAVLGRPPERVLDILEPSRPDKG